MRWDAAAGGREASVVCASPGAMPGHENRAIEVVEPDIDVRQPEVALLLSSMRSSLLGLPFGGPGVGLNWTEVARLAQASRWLPVLARVLGPHRDSAPPEFWALVERYRALTLKLNGANLLTLRTIIAAFERANIDVLVLKGPSAQLALYGDCFFKPSTDVDLLVRPRDFTRAGEVVTACGFTMPAECASIWWRVFLGEQHYLSGDGATVDLHHRVQQPGCPSPRSLEDFFRSKSHVALGSTGIPVLNRRHACLLSCMSLVKAMANREAGGAHAADIAACLAGASEEDIRLLFDAARACGLLRTLCAGLRIVSVLFGVRVRGVAPDKAFEFLDDDYLLQSVMDPSGAASRPAARTEMLWALSGDVGVFAAELVWKFAAEGARMASAQFSPASKAGASQDSQTFG